MKRLIASAMLVGMFALPLTAPASAQETLKPVNPAAEKAAAAGEAKAFMARYVAAFNKGDAAGLARDFYAVPGVSSAEMQTKLAAQFDKLRQDDFGHVDVYGMQTCVLSGSSVDLQMKFANQYAYGGVMPPGDLSTIFHLGKSGGVDGWRILSVKEGQATTGMACAL